MLILKSGTKLYYTFYVLKQHSEQLIWSFIFLLSRNFLITWVGLVKVHWEYLTHDGVWSILVRGNIWPPKDYQTSPPQGVRGPQPPMVTKFKNLKRFEVVENESIFQKYLHFCCPKNPFFRKNFEKWTYFTKLFGFLLKIIENFNFYWVTI